MPTPTRTTPIDWRCTACGHLLGKCQGGRVLIQFARGHRYVVSRPATGQCRRCKTLNEV